MYIINFVGIVFRSLLVHTLQFEKYFKPFHSQAQKVHSPNLLKGKCVSDVVRIGSIIISHLSKAWVKRRI